MLLDYQDFLRQNDLELWPKDHPKAPYIRKLAYKEDKTYKTYRTYIEEKSPETAANTMVCLIHQANFLLDRLMKELETAFVEGGGFTERMHRIRSQNRER